MLLATLALVAVVAYLAFRSWKTRQAPAGSESEPSAAAAPPKRSPQT